MGLEHSDKTYPITGYCQWKYKGDSNLGYDFDGNSDYSLNCGEKYRLKV